MTNMIIYRKKLTSPDTWLFSLHPEVKMNSHILCILLLCYVSKVFSAKYEQVHLSLGKDPSEMVVTWVTQTPLYVSPAVEYQTSSKRYTIEGNTTRLDIGERSIYIHRAAMRFLDPGTTYAYRVGDGVSWSPFFSFRALKENSNWHPSVVLFGDMSFDGQSISRLKNEENVHAIFHIGK